MSLMHHTPATTGQAATDPEFAITTVDHGGIAVLTVVGEFDQLSLEQFGYAVAATLYDAVRVLVVDLTAATFLSTGAMVALIDAQHRTTSTGGRMIVAAHGPATARPLHLSGVSKTVTVCSTLKAALDICDDIPATPALASAVFSFDEQR
jgi:anti-anti-sigma factor